MKPISIAPVLLVICFRTLSGEPSGTIEGRVTLAGAPRPESRIDLSAHPQIEAAHPDGLKTRRYQVGENGGLMNVLIYLRGEFSERKFETPEKPALLEHTKVLFEPYVSGIRAGQPLQLRNSYLCSFHAITSSNREISYAFSAVCSFTNAEVPIKFKCDLHPWNYAYVGVFSHPYFAATDKDGSFKIGGVPPGRYAIEMFHPASGKLSREVVVENQRSVNVDFSLAAN